MPKVSIIIPVYNGQKTISTMAHSVVAQDYSDIEVIAINDGSTDNSASILKKFSSIQVISQENAGVSASRNLGIQEATGDYIAFIDQDDVWTADKITRQVHVLETTGADYVFNNFYRFNYDTSQKYSKTNSELNSYIYKYVCQHDPEYNIIAQDVMFKMLLRGYPIYPSTMLIRHRLFENSGSWDSRFPRCQDFDLSLRCTRFTNFAYIDAPLTGIGRHSTNVSANYLDQLAEDIEVCLYHCESNFFSPEEVKIIKYWLGRRLRGIAWNYAQHDDFQTCRNYYIKALKYSASFLDALLHLPFTFPPLSSLWKIRE